MENHTTRPIEVADWRGLKPHAMAGLYPDMEADEFSLLCKSIKATGLGVPVVIYEGQVIDGRHRLRACEVVGVEPRFEEYVGDDPDGFAFGLNEARRHLDVAARAKVASRRANAQRGGSDGFRGNQHMAADEAAERSKDEGGQSAGESNGQDKQAKPRITQAEAAREQGVSVSAVKAMARADRVLGPANVDELVADGKSIAAILEAARAAEGAGEGDVGTQEAPEGDGHPEPAMDKQADTDADRRAERHRAMHADRHSEVRWEEMLDKGRWALDNGLWLRFDPVLVNEEGASVAGGKMGAERGNLQRTCAVPPSDEGYLYALGWMAEQAEQEREQVEE